VEKGQCMHVAAIYTSAGPARRGQRGKSGCWWTEAAAHGRVEAIKLLVQLGADKEAKNVDGVAPLHLAAVYRFRTARRSL
jgi:hypothetical protein